MAQNNPRGFGFSKKRKFTLRIMYSLVILVLAVIWAIRCGDDRIDNRIIVEPPPIIIFGVVIDSITNQPLQAWVGFDSIYDSSSNIFTIANTNGQYRIPGHPSHTQIFSSIDSYDTQMKEFELNPGDSTDIDFKLIPW